MHKEVIFRYKVLSKLLNWGICGEFLEKDGIICKLAEVVCKTEDLVYENVESAKSYFYSQQAIFDEFYSRTKELEEILGKEIVEKISNDALYHDLLSDIMGY